MKIKKLNEANYGGAFDIADDQYFTRDDLNELSNEVLEIVQKSFDNKLDISSSYIENGNELEVTLIDEDGIEFTSKVKIDMRKIKKPSDLSDKYKTVLADDLINQISEYRKEFIEDANESLKRENIDLSTYKRTNDDITAGGKRYSIYRKVVGGKGKWAAQEENSNGTVGDPFEITYEQATGSEPINNIDRMSKHLGKKLSLKKEALEGEDGWPDEIYETLNGFLDKCEDLSYEINNCVRGAKTRAETIDELVSYLYDLEIDLKDSISILEDNEEVLTEDLDAFNNPDLNLYSPEVVRHFKNMAQDIVVFTNAHLYDNAVRIAQKFIDSVSAKRAMDREAGWDYSDNKMKESFEGEYSDKFRALAKEWKYNEDDLLSLINEIIRYCPEEDLKDLWIHNRYNLENDLNENKESIKIDEDDKLALALIRRYRNNNFDLSQLHRYVEYIYKDKKKAVERLAELDTLSDDNILSILGEKLTESDDEDEDKFKRANLMSHI